MRGVIEFDGSYVNYIGSYERWTLLIASNLPLQQKKLRRA